MAISRRKAIFGTLAAGGALIIGYGFWPYPQREKVRALLGHGPDSAVLSTWVKVSRDNRVTVIVPHSDMGQGAQTALAQMLADEMDVDWSLVDILEAPAHDAFANADIAVGFLGEFGIPEALIGPISSVAPKLARLANLQITGGSASVRYTGMLAMRPAGAAARAIFRQAAAEAWNVPVENVRTSLSHAVHPPTQRRISYGDLIEIAARQTPPEKPPLKIPKDFTIMGLPVPRHDIPEKVNGSAHYGVDTRLEGMRYAAIKQSPVFGGTVESIDEAAIKNMRGVERIVKLDGTVAVIADNTWRAMNAVKALPVTFAGGDSAGLSSDSIFASFEQAVAAAPAKDDRKQGEIDAALNGAATVIEATYRAPFLAHAPMEPLSCTVVARADGTAEAWVGSQNPLGARGAVASALNISEDKVMLHNLRMGGGFGRRSDTDWITQTARIAAAMPGTPIKLIWSREEDTQHDKFRPAGLSRFRGGFDKDGNPVAWFNVYNWKDQPGNAALIPYGIAHQHIGWVDATAPIPTGPWRSVAHSRHGFFTESFADEMAHAAGMDPYTFRKKLLVNAPRHRAVLDLAAEKAGWGIALPAGHGRGIALQEAFGTITAQVAEVSVNDAGVVKVERVVCAVDCGDVINPDTAEAQIQSGVNYGLSAALYGEIKIRDGKVEQSNFDDYPVVRLADAPRIEVHFIRSGAPMGGLGEPGTPGIAPAVANAIFDATGERLRSMPLRLNDAAAREQQVGRR